MTLFVVRHAIAQDPAPGQRDATRAVTDLGRTRARLVLSHARRVGVRPTTLLSSPYKRAIETARIAHEELALTAPPVEISALVPYVSVTSLWNELRTYVRDGDLMVVGHNPQLSLLVSWLLGARGDALWLKKSGLVRLTLDSAGMQPHASLEWLMTPRSVGR